MLILTIRTDKPEAELGLYDDGQQLAYLKWPAHRELAETMHSKINELLADHSQAVKNIQAVVAYKGPGSFTGLRIGLSVANALAASLQIPIVSATGDKWLEDGLADLQQGTDEKLATPEYGAPPHITHPKH
jgi:tRNA threonylcarbamoyladenosine biosynthesis protein TsaB